MSVTVPEVTMCDKIVFKELSEKTRMKIMRMLPDILVVYNASILIVKHGDDYYKYKVRPSYEQYIKTGMFEVYHKDEIQYSDLHDFLLHIYGKNIVFDITGYYLGKE